MRKRICGALVLYWVAAWAQPTPPPGGGTSTAVTYYATYKLDGGTASQSGQTYTAGATDTSAIWVANSGVLTLTNPAITTSGNTSSQDNSSFYGLNAGLLVTSGQAIVTGGTITVTGGNIVASGQDSPAIYSTGKISVTGATMRATGVESAAR